MLEALYLGSEQVEEKYLHNFSKEEKAEFRLHIQKEQEFSNRVMSKISRLIADGVSVEFMAHDEPRSSTALDIKYALNRIAANDPRDIVFSLSQVDREIIDNPDRLALDIAKAFRQNTNCKNVILNSIGVTDNGMIPILHTLSKKELYLLDIGGNNITDKSLEVLSTSMASLENKWKGVSLGKIQVSPEQDNVLKRHSNLHYVPELVYGRAVAAPAATQKPQNIMKRMFQR